VYGTDGRRLANTWLWCHFTTRRGNSTSGTGTRITVDERGRYSFDALVPAHYRVEMKLDGAAPVAREMELEEGQIGKISKMLGSGNTYVIFPDGSKMFARIRGKLRKRIWMKTGDIVLVSPWDFNSAKGDIFFRYTRDQAWELVGRKYITRDFLLMKLRQN